VCLIFKKIGKTAEPAARAKGRGRGKLDEARAPPGEPSQGKLIKDDGIRKEDGLRKEDARRDKVSADRRGVPIDSTKPSGMNESNCIKLGQTILVSAAEEQKGSKGKEKGDTTAQVPKPGVSDATRKDDGKVSLKETKGEPDIASRKQAETVGKGWEKKLVSFGCQMIFVHFQMKKPLNPNHPKIKKKLENQQGHLQKKEKLKQLEKR